MSRQIQTPDGEVGVALEWPLGSSMNFRLLTGMGEHVDNVVVKPVRLESGEVRFFVADVLKLAE